MVEIFQAAEGQKAYLTPAPFQPRDAKQSQW